MNYTENFRPAACMLLAPVLLILVAVLPLKAGETVAMFTGNFNFDKLPDTLYGLRQADRMIVPDFIAWGVCPAGDSSACAPDSSLKLQRIARHKRRARTAITLPNWQVLRVSTSLKRFNTADTLDDLLFFMWGRSKARHAPEDDTTQMIALFGQHGLDTLAEINLAPVGKGGRALKEQPFIALDMRAQASLGKARHRSQGRRSWEMHLFDMSLLPDSSGAGESIMPGQSAPKEALLQLYPNPGWESAAVEAHALEAGSYSLELLTLGGRTMYRREGVRIAAGASLHAQLPLDDCATGYYIVRLSRDGLPLESIPLVVSK